MNPDRLHERWWLSGDLAGHVATYGVWLKGVADWRERAFISSWTRRKKMGHVLEALSSVYIRRAALTPLHVMRYLERALLEALRLRWLCEGRFVGATVELMAEALDDNFEVIDVLPKIFGAAPLTMISEVVATFSRGPVRSTIADMFTGNWERKIADDLNWRLAGRPGQYDVKVRPTPGDKPA